MKHMILILSMIVLGTSAAAEIEISQNDPMAVTLTGSEAAQLLETLQVELDLNEDHLLFASLDCPEPFSSLARRRCVLSTGKGEFLDVEGDGQSVVEEIWKQSRRLVIKSNGLKPLMGDMAIVERLECQKVKGQAVCEMAFGSGGGAARGSLGRGL